MKQKREGLHISHEFDEELLKLQQGMMRMGGQVESQLLRSLKSLEEQDLLQAQAVLEDDQSVNEMEMEVDMDCVVVIAKRQPAARDLRLILAISRSVFELERIGDETLKIARAALTLNDNFESPEVGQLARRSIRAMGKMVITMLRKSLDAFAREDLKGALDVAQSDQDVDSTFQSSIMSLTRLMEKNPDAISECVSLLWALRALERIGDHACNITEHLVYFKRGTNVRHSELEEKAEVIK